VNFILYKVLEVRNPTSTPMMNYQLISGVFWVFLYLAVCFFDLAGCSNNHSQKMKGFPIMLELS
jgi:hypothetical protein